MHIYPVTKVEAYHSLTLTAAAQVLPSVKHFTKITALFYSSRWDRYMEWLCFHCNMKPESKGCKISDQPLQALMKQPKYYAALM